MATWIYSRGSKDDSEIEISLSKVFCCNPPERRIKLDFFQESPWSQHRSPQILKYLENVAEGSKNSKQNSDNGNYFLELGEESRETPNLHQATSLPDLIEADLLQNGVPKLKVKPSPHVNKICTMTGHSSTEEEHLDQISAAHKHNQATMPVHKKSCHTSSAMVDEMRCNHQTTALKKCTKFKDEEIIRMTKNEKHCRSCKVDGMSHIVTSADKFQVGDNIADTVLPNLSQNPHKENRRHKEGNRRLAKKKSHSKIKKHTKENLEKSPKTESPRYRAPTESSRIRASVTAEQVNNLKVGLWSPRYLRMSNSKKRVPSNTVRVLGKKKSPRYSDCKKSYRLDNYRHCVSVPKLQQSQYQHVLNFPTRVGGKNDSQSFPLVDIYSLLKHKDCKNSCQFDHFRDGGSVPKCEQYLIQHAQYFPSGMREKSNFQSSPKVDTGSLLKYRESKNACPFDNFIDSGSLPKYHQSQHHQDRYFPTSIPENSVSQNTHLQLQSRGPISSSAQAVAKGSLAVDTLEQRSPRRVHFTTSHNADNNRERKRQALRTEDTVNYVTDEFVNYNIVSCTDTDVSRITQFCRHKKYRDICHKCRKETTKFGTRLQSSTIHRNPGSYQGDSCSSLCNDE